MRGARIGAGVAAAVAVAVALGVTSASAGGDRAQRAAKVFVRTVVEGREEISGSPVLTLQGRNLHRVRDVEVRTPAGEFTARVGNTSFGVKPADTGAAILPVAIEPARYDLVFLSSAGTELYRAAVDISSGSVHGYAAGSGAGVLAENAATGTALVASHGGTSGSIASFQASGTERMRIDRNGSVTQTLGTAPALTATGSLAYAGYQGFVDLRCSGTARTIYAENSATGGGLALFARKTGTSGDTAVLDYSGTGGGHVLILQQNGTGGAFMVCDRSDNATRVARIDQAGRGYFNGGTAASGADFAESVAVNLPRERFGPGDVLVIDVTGDRRFALCSEPESRLVAGVCSTRPAVLGSVHDVAGDPAALDREVPLGIVGIVPTKVCDEGGPVRRGDLLVTSSVPGHARRAPDDPRVGTVLGKALGELPSGRGVIEVLLVAR